MLVSYSNHSGTQLQFGAHLLCNVLSVVFLLKCIVVRTPFYILRKLHSRAFEVVYQSTFTKYNLTFTPTPRHCKFKYVTGATPACLPHYTLIQLPSENDVILIIEELVQVEMMLFKILSSFITFLNIKKNIHKKMA
jgi:hypothetical protein